MGHDHDHAHHDHAHHDCHPRADGQGFGDKGFALAFALNFIFAIIELAGGLFTNSISILSDSLHDFGDAAALGLAWYLEKVSGKKADRTHSYGYRRYSLLSALIISTILACGSIFISYRAIGRLFYPEAVKVQGMMVLAVAGILVNGLAFRFTHRGASHNGQAVALHFLEDVLGWVAVLVASIVMLFIDVRWLDPALSLAISIYIFWGAVKRIRETARIFLQTVPPIVDLSKLKSDLENVGGVSSVEDLHVWSTDGQQIIVTLSVRCKHGETDRASLRSRLKQALGELAKHHVTIELLDSEEPSLGCEPV